MPGPGIDRPGRRPNGLRNAESPRRHGARNDIPATVTAIERGDVMARVEVEPVGTAHRVAPVMRVDSLEEPDRPRRATPSTRSPRRCALLVKPQPPGAGPPSPRRHPVVIGLA
ncbi:hypothetical protein ME121_6409 [Methylobacterium sp. ME121]|jgi:hypothetical protein|nr:hypothetical protein ME121_6409 [Methylobacterium sp. ME121]